MKMMVLSAALILTVSMPAHAQT